MRILFDNNVPLYVVKLFEGHQVSTAYCQGWASLRNGRLLTVAEEDGFDLLVTMDKNMQHQQNIQERKLRIAVLDPQGQDKQDTIVTARNLLDNLDRLRPGEALTFFRDKA